MKKIFFKKATALIISMALLLTCIFAVGITSVADTFTSNDVNNVITDLGDGWYDIKLNSMVTSDYKIDLTKGFYFQFINPAWFTGISFMETAGGTPTQFNKIGDSTIAASLFTICGSTVDEYIATNSLDTQIGQVFTSFKRDDLLMIQFRPVIINGETPTEVFDGSHTHYAIYINGVADRICFEKTVFEKLNGYDTVTGAFSGCYIGITDRSGQHPEFKIKPITMDDIYAESGITVKDYDNSWQNIDFEYTWKNMTFDYKIDLTKGFYFQFVEAAFFTNFSFKETMYAAPTPFNSTTKMGEAAVDTKYSICGYETDAWIQTGSLPNQASTIWAVLITPYTCFKASFKPVDFDVANNPIVTTDAEADYYLLYLNDGNQETHDEILYDAATFKKLNGYNEATGEFSGCYINVENGSNHALQFNFAPAVKADRVIPAEAFVENNTGVPIDYKFKAPYSVKIGCWQDAKSTFRTDLTEGITFDISDLAPTVAGGAEYYVALGLSGNYFESPKFPIDISDYNTWCILFQNVNDEIVAYSRVDNFVNRMSTGLSVKESHTLSFEINDDGVYQAYLDDVMLTCAGATISEKAFIKYNNEYSQTNNKGAYIQLGAFTPGTVTVDIASAKWVTEHIGDVNNDDTLYSEADFAELQKALLGIESENYTSLLSDVNNDKVIDITDLVTFDTRIVPVQ